MLISIVVPVYKSNKTLIELADRIDRVFKNIPNADFELIFVNDSPFFIETKDTLKKLAIGDSRITCIELTRNFGQQPATLCGLEFSRGDYVVTMDDDLQHAPEDIPLLLSKKSHDVVIAHFAEKQHSFGKRVASYVKGYFDKIILGKPASIKLSSFRLINMKIAKMVLAHTTPYPFIPALLFRITTDIVNVTVEHHPRTEGKSHYTLARMITLFSNLLINNSSLLLRLMGYIGFFIAALAFIYAVVIIFRVLLADHAIAGWPSTFTAILFFGGMTLLTLGITGEYLVRIIATSEDRAPYHVRSISSGSHAESGIENEESD